MKPLATIEQAIEDIRQGKMIILVDDEDRENEGDLVCAADLIDAEKINFFITHGRGLVCLPMAGEMLDRMELPMMVKNNMAKYQTAFTVSIEAATGISTGISAHDRAHTVKTAVSKDSKPSDIVSPGHIFPLRARDGGVLIRAGHTEGTVDLARMAGLQPAAVLCEIMKEDGTMARMPDLEVFAEQHDINIVSIKDIIAYRMRNECLVEQISSAKLPVGDHGEFTIKVFENTMDDQSHVVLQKGDINADTPVLVRVHSECLTGDVFGSSRCDCGWQLQAALAQISEQGGVLVYMKQEGRGIGLANKIKAYALQDTGLDTVEANQKLGFKADHRDYGLGSQILRHLGVNKMRLLTNNPRKIYGIDGYGLEIVERVAIEMKPHQNNVAYLKTKREKLGHMLTLEEELEA